jgi:hypothetical protein
VKARKALGHLVTWPFGNLVVWPFGNLATVGLLDAEDPLLLHCTAHAGFRPIQGETVRHATPDDLNALESLLIELRRVPGLVERKRGNFTRKSRAFLHFHQDPAGLFADLREEEDFVRYRVATRREQKAFAGRVRRLSAGGPKSAS